MKFIYIFLIYFATISLVTFFVTFADKRKAVKGKYRISEATLFIFAFLGGALSEYITMRLIHHKTLHKRFMIGLPLIIFFQFVFYFLILYYLS